MYPIENFGDPLVFCVGVGPNVDPPLRALANAFPNFDGQLIGGTVLFLDILHIPYYDVRRIEKENIMAVATLTSKGQITIPSRVRDALGLETGDRVEFVEQGNGQYAIVAATRSVQELKGRFQGKRSKQVSIEEMNAAIARRASGSR
jgi:AbrB family looped-hinge helix DNA binding protein